MKIDSPKGLSRTQVWSVSVGVTARFSSFCNHIWTVSDTPIANPRIHCRELYQDGWFVALDKPAGVVTQPGAGHKSDSLLNGLFATDGATHERLGGDRDWGLLHRLDKDTSGVVLVARMKEAYDAIRTQFEERSIEKTYIAVCRGRLPQVRGTCRQSLNEVRRGDMKVSVPAQRGAGSKG